MMMAMFFTETEYIMKKFFLVVFMFFVILMSLSSCINQDGSSSSSSEDSHTSIESNLNSPSQASSEDADYDYDPFAIQDNGLFKNEYFGQTDYLRHFILLLKRKNIAIIEIIGASRAPSGDAGSIHFRDATWDHDFSKQMDSVYDVDMLDELIQKQPIQAVYVKTKYETYTFAQDREIPVQIVPIEKFALNKIITTNPDFISEKGVKIGDSFESAEKIYSFEERYYKKIPDSDWSAWDPDAEIAFYGSKHGISSIELGVKPTRAEH